MGASLVVLVGPKTALATGRRARRAFLSMLHYRAGAKNHHFNSPALL